MSSSSQLKKNHLCKTLLRDASLILLGHWITQKEYMTVCIHTGSIERSTIISSQVSTCGKFSRLVLYFMRRSQSAAATFVGTRSRPVVVDVESVTADLAARYRTYGNSWSHPFPQTLWMSSIHMPHSIYRDLDWHFFFKKDRELRHTIIYLFYLHWCKYSRQSCCNCLNAFVKLTSTLVTLSKQKLQGFIIVCDKPLR